MNKAILFLMLGALIFLAGCTDINDIINNSVSSTKNTDYSDYKMPANYEVQTFEIATPDRPGLIMETYEIKEYEKVNLSQISLDWQKAREEQNKYDAYRKIADDNSIEIEEDNLKQYCDSLISNSCMNMNYIEDHNGCREVKTECRKYNCDDVCIKYDISIVDNYVDEDKCN